MVLGDYVIYINGKAQENFVEESAKYFLINAKFISSSGLITKKVTTRLSPALKDDITIVLSDIPNGQALAKCFFVDNSESFTVNQRIAILRAKTAAFPKYLFYLLNRHNYFLKFNDGVNQTNLKKSDIINMPVSLPPLPEQKKIAEILSTWDEAIETNKRLLASIEKHRASQLKNYFMKTKSSSTNKSLEELEDSDSIKLGRGRVISRDEMKLSKGLFPVYSSSIKNNGLMGYLDEYLFDEEMITWSIDGGGNFFYRDKHKFSVTNVSGFMRIIDDNIKPYFLANQLQYLHSKLVFDYQTKAHPSVIRSLYKVQIPTLNEQTRFEFLFKSIDKQIEKINQYINELQKQKQGLMQRLLTGKVRVKLD
ncbi:MAG: restriction endonuclease subunit S [Candidatus Cloacimonetes bacterium]|nr:restriction endonuclease subunit S [Candidatus Cloacimonadota bacterium]